MYGIKFQLYVKISQIKSYTNGIFKDADRRMLSFSAYEEPDYISYRFIENK